MSKNGLSLKLIYQVQVNHCCLNIRVPEPITNIQQRLTIKTLIFTES